MAAEVRLAQRQWVQQASPKQWRQVGVPLEARWGERTFLGEEETPGLLLPLPPPPLRRLRQRRRKRGRARCCSLAVGA